MGSTKLGVHYIIDHHSRLELAMIEESLSHGRNILHQDVILLSDPINENAFTDTSQIANQLALILRKYQFKPQEIDFTISSKEIFIQSMLLPTMKERDLDKSILFELSTTFPNFQDSYAHSSKYIVKNGSISCFVAFCPYTILKPCFAIAVALSLPLRNITFSGNSLAKMGQVELQQNLDGNQIFIYLGSRNVLFSVCAHGECIAYDYLEDGVETLNQKITQLHTRIKEDEQSTIFNESLFFMIQSELPQFSQVLIALVTRYLGGMEQQHGQIYLYSTTEINTVFTHFLQHELTLPCQIVPMILDVMNQEAFFASSSTIPLKKKGDFLFTLQNRKKLPSIWERIRNVKVGG